MLMSDPHECVLAHMAAILQQKDEVCFPEAANYFGLQTPGLVAYGFLKGPDDPPTIYGALQTAWLAAIS